MTPNTRGSIPYGRHGGARRAPLIFPILALALVLSGCVQVATPSLHPSSPSAPLATVVVARTTLPTLEGIEPGLAVGPDGRTVLATAPVLEGTGQNLPLRGGAAWVSHDGGRTFKLTLDPTTGPSAPVPILETCSCDTSGAILTENTMAVATLVWATSATNAENTISIMTSHDGGASWALATPEATLRGPLVDRPWLTPTAGGRLHLTYSAAGAGNASWAANASDIADHAGDALAFSIYDARSHEGGRAWLPGPAVWKDGFATSGQPRFVAPKHLLIPIFGGDYTGPPPGNETDTIVLVSSDDDAATFHVVNVSAPFVDQVPIGLGMDADAAGDVVMAWAGTALSGNASWLHARVSRDFGATWGPIVSVPVAGTAVMPSVAIGPNGTVALAYYGSNSSAPLVEQGKDTNWTARVALLDRNLTVRRVLEVSPHPVYQGVSCYAPCTDSGYRSPLGDFLSVAWTRNGTLLVAYTDRSVHHEGTRGGDLVVARIVGAASVARASR